MKLDDRSMLLSKEYEDMLVAEHQQYTKWGTSASTRHMLDIVEFFNYFKISKNVTMLDYGCGKQILKSVLPFPSKEFHMYDPGIPLYNKKPPKCDVVFCLDVLEHIEPEYLDSVLEHIASRLLRVGFFYIHCAEAKHILKDGRNAHLIVENGRWWLDKLDDYFDIVLMKNVSRGVYFWVKPLRDKSE